MGRDYEEGEPVPDPLPEGAATEATLESLDGKDFATQTTLAEFYNSFGDTTDASTTAGGAGTAQAKLRKMTSQLNDLANLIGEVAANPTSNTLQDRLKRAVAALEVMDDWDEGDRAKVNAIVGQAGVAANAGAADDKTQRVILASDDPLVSKAYDPRGGSGSPTTEAVDDTVGGTVLASANSSRKELILCNMADQAVVFVDFGTPTTGAFLIYLAPKKTASIPHWTGAVKGITKSGETADVRVMEVTA